MDWTEVEIWDINVSFVVLGNTLKVKRLKGRSGVFQHCCRLGGLYSYPKWVPSFISRGAAHQAAWETSASEGRNYTKEFS